jgi:hypothetical protein
MKLAWLVIDEYGTEIFFEEPEYYSGKLIAIVYTELEDSNEPKTP